MAAPASAKKAMATKIQTVNGSTEVLPSKSMRSKRPFLKTPAALRSSHSIATALRWPRLASLCSFTRTRPRPGRSALSIASMPSGKFCEWTPLRSGVARSWLIPTLGVVGIPTVELADGAPGYPNAATMYDGIAEDMFEALNEMRIADEFGATNTGGAGPAFKQFYDFTDTATLAPNIDGTGTIAANGPIGSITDKGSAGIDLVAPADDGTRPTYLAEGAADYGTSGNRLLYSRNSSVDPFADGAAGGWTMALAMRYQAGSGYQKLFGFDDNPNGNAFWMCYADSSGRTGMRIRDSAGTTIQDRTSTFNFGNELIDGQNYVLVFVYNGSQIVPYIDKVGDGLFAKGVDFSVNQVVHNTFGLGHSTSDTFSTSDAGRSIIHQWKYFSSALSTAERETMTDEMASAQGRTL